MIWAIASVLSAASFLLPVIGCARDEVPSSPPRTPTAIARTLGCGLEGSTAAGAPREGATSSRVADPGAERPGDGHAAARRGALPANTLPPDAVEGLCAPEWR